MGVLCIAVCHTKVGPGVAISQGCGTVGKEGCLQVGVGLGEPHGSLHCPLGFTVALRIAKTGSARGKTLSCSKGTKTRGRKLGLLSDTTVHGMPWLANMVAKAWMMASALVERMTVGRCCD